MKKLYILPLVMGVVALLFTSCGNFDELKENKNLAESVPASILLNNVLYSLHDGPGGMNERWCQYYLMNYDYYGNNRYDFGAGDNYYSTLKNVVQMEKESNGNQAYQALAYFLRAYYFSKMSLEMGDIPLNEALDGVNNLTPKYDTQKAVFLQVFDWLEKANTLLAAEIAKGTTIDGDFYYSNNLSKWQKLVNTFRLRLLIHLSKKTADTDLNVATQFAKIVGNSSIYPIMTGASDNLQFNYLYPSNMYPRNPGTYGYNATRENCSDTYLGLLTSLHDPRTFITAEPAQARLSSYAATDFNAFKGANPGEDLGQMYSKNTNGEYSMINRYHFYRTYTGEPSLEVSYQEMCFNIAEAINRGWISAGPLGDAEAHYKAGIQASWAFYSIPSSGSMSVYFMKQGSGISDASPYNSYTVNVDWDTYYNQSAVKYAGNTNTGLTQILTQRYLALAFHSGLESYFTYRRTGVPVFQTGTGTGNNQKIPTRFKYFDTEKTTNATNYAAAIAAYSNNDDINGLMWLLK